MSSTTVCQRSYQATDETSAALAELRAAFRLNSDSAVIRRALSLSRILACEAKDHTVTIERKDGSKVQILLDAQT